MMNRIDTALARAANRALDDTGRCRLGRSGQVEVIAVLAGMNLLWVALDIDLSINVECELLDALAANDATSPGPVD